MRARIGILLPVLTDHEISVVVREGVVISAIIDNFWDELNQTFSDQGEEYEI